MTTLHTFGGETMGTTWSVRAAAAPNRDLHALHAGVQARLDLVVRQMSTWTRDSDISAYNRAAPGEWREIPREFAEVLACALDVAAASDGAFDPAVGALVGLWGFGADARGSTPPEAMQLDAARSHGDWRRIVFDPATRRLLQPGGVRLDLSAIAKGYGTDLAAAWLREHGVAGALVEVGGELRGYGRKPDGGAWRVLVESAPDLEDDDAEPRVLELDGIAVATSGDRWHHHDVPDGSGGTRRLSHTIDPRSGRPVADAAAAVTVVAPDAMHADAWATALTVLGADAGFALAQRRGLAARFLLRGGAGADERMTDAFRAHLAA